MVFYWLIISVTYKVWDLIHRDFTEKKRKEEYLSCNGHITEAFLIPEVFEGGDHVGLEVVPAEAELLVVGHGEMLFQIVETLKLNQHDVIMTPNVEACNLLILKWIAELGLKHWMFTSQKLRAVAASAPRSMKVYDSNPWKSSIQGTTIEADKCDLDIWLIVFLLRHISTCKIKLFNIPWVRMKFSSSGLDGMG